MESELSSIVLENISRTFSESQEKYSVKNLSALSSIVLESSHEDIVYCESTSSDLKTLKTKLEEKIAELNEEVENLEILRTMTNNTKESVSFFNQIAEAKHEIETLKNRLLKSEKLIGEKNKETLVIESKNIFESGRCVECKKCLVQ